MSVDSDQRDFRKRELLAHIDGRKLETRQVFLMALARWFLDHVAADVWADAIRYATRWSAEHWEEQTALNGD